MKKVTAAAGLALLGLVPLPETAVAHADPQDAQLLHQARAAGLPRDDAGLINAGHDVCRTAPQPGVYIGIAPNVALNMKLDAELGAMGFDPAQKKQFTRIAVGIWCPDLLPLAR